MTVIVAKDMPPRARGLMKRWFSEPKPGVFVGTLNPRVHKNVMAHISEQCPPETRMLIISSDGTCQGYRMEQLGEDGSEEVRIIDLAGIRLIAKRPNHNPDAPF